MPIVNATIKTSIVALINQTKALEQAEAQDQFATLLANLIETTIKSATVTLAPSSIIVVGSATTQTNIAPAIGTLS